MGSLLFLTRATHCRMGKAEMPGEKARRRRRDYKVQFVTSSKPIDSNSGLIKTTTDSSRDDVHLDRCRYGWRLGNRVVGRRRRASRHGQEEAGEHGLQELGRRGFHAHGMLEGMKNDDPACRMNRWGLNSS